MVRNFLRLCHEKSSDMIFVVQKSSVNKFSLSFALTMLFVFSPFLVVEVVKAATINIENLVFTTDERRVLPGAISEALTVQTQNESGASEQVDETNDVTFSSTSATGEFLSSTGNAVSGTMSKNTSSRTFYYRDSTLGTPTISVEIKGRDTGTTFSATQQIIISNEVVATSTTSTTQTGTTTSSTSSTISSHSSDTDISEITDKYIFKADAGRERIVMEDSPIEFTARISEDAEKRGVNKYIWSFGDGSSGTGKIVTHNYKFVGDYNVVLNVFIDDNTAVSRTKVKVVKPEFTILEFQAGLDGYVKISNNSEYEMNLGDWQIKSGATSSSAVLTFTRDTIIDGQSSISFPVDNLLSSTEIFLTNPDGNMFAVYKGIDIALETKKKIAIGEIEQKLVLLKNELALAYNKNNFFTPTVTTGNNDEANVSQVAGTSTSAEIQTASLIEAFNNHEENNGFFKRGFRFIKSIFQN